MRSGGNNSEQAEPKCRDNDNVMIGSGAASQDLLKMRLIWHGIWLVWKWRVRTSFMQINQLPGGLTVEIVTIQLPYSLAD
jgi:hypothetical protein